MRLALPRLALPIFVAICCFMLCSSLGASCAVEGFVLLDGAAGAGGTGGGGSVGGSAGAAGGICGHVQAPPPPATSDAGNDVEIVLAMRDFDIGETALENGPLVGYDLDALCSCRGDGPSCNPPPYAEADTCDGPSGRDNAAAGLWEASSVFVPELASTAMTAEITAGHFTLLMRIRNYNGQPNDERVEVAFFASPGRDNDPCLTVPPAPPTWNGNDSWPVASTSLTPNMGAGGGCSAPGFDLEAPRYIDPDAYVTGGTLVATLDDLAFLIRNEDTLAEIHLKVASITGRLEQAASGWLLEEGVVAGRWPVEELRLAFVALAANGVSLCSDSPLYENLRNAVCNYPDIASALSGPTTPCDAVSFGLSFAAAPALLGSIWEHVTPPSMCAPGTDPAADSCESRL